MYALFPRKINIFLKKFLLSTGVVGHGKIALVYLGLLCFKRGRVLEVLIVVRGKVRVRG